MKQERILVDEGLTLYIKEGDKVRKIVVKKPRSEWTFWDHLKALFRLQKGSLTTYGKNQAAQLFLGLTPAYSVDSIGAITTTGEEIWRGPTDTDRYYVGTGTVRIVNERNPFPGGKNYTKIRCRSSNYTADYHNEISISLNLSGASNVSFWAEVRFVFS